MPTPVAERTTVMAIDPRTLQLHADFLRRVALGLLGDMNLAEDAVQRTWITTMGRSPEHPSKIRAWLASVTRNEARQIARSESRRRSREERSSRREAVPSASDIAERERIRREVVDAVMQLPEASRDVILLRYYEDLPPREIARRLEMPVETVRTRLKRGIERMRSALDRKHESREAWRSALLPFVVPAGGVIAGAGAGAGSAGSGVGAGGAAGGAASAGVPAVPAVAIVASGVLATTLVIFAIAWRAGVGPFDETTTPAAAVAAESSVADSVASDSEDAATAGAAAGASAPAFVAAIPAGTESQSGEGRTAIRGRIVDANGAPCVNHEVFVMGRRGESLDEVGLFSTSVEPVDPSTILRRSTRTDGEGRYAFEGLPPGSYLTIARAIDTSPLRFFGVAFVALRDPVPPALFGMLEGAFATIGLPTPAIVEVVEGGVIDLDLERIPGRRLRGRVVDSYGAPIADARIVSAPAMFLNSVDALDQPILPPFCEATTNADGEYLLDGALGSTGVGITAVGYVPRVDVVEVPEPAGGENESVLEDRVLDPAATWRVAGQVFDAHGPIEGATATFVPARIVMTPQGPLPGSMPQTTTGELGEFTITFETPIDEPAVLRFEADGYGSIDARLANPESPECGDLRIVLEREALVRTRVVAGVDSDVTGVTVFAFDLENYGIREVAETDDEGVAEFRMLGEGRTRFAVSSIAGYKDLTYEADFSQGFPGDEIELRMTPVDRTFSLRVADENGVALAEKLELAGVERSFPYYSLHRFDEDPTDLVARGWLHEMLENREFGDHDNEIHDGERDGEFRVELDARWMSDSGWIVLRAAGHAPVVQSYGPDTDAIALALDLSHVRSNVAVLVAKPKTSWWQSVRDLVAVVDTEDGRRVAGVVNDVRGATVLLEQAGRHRVRLVTNQGVGTADVDVELGSVETVEVRIRSGGSISGTVVRSVEAPVELERPRSDVEIGRAEPNVVIHDGTEIKVRVYDRDGRLLESETTSDGRFSIHGIPPGECIVRAYVPGFGYAQETVMVESGEEIEDLRIGVERTPFSEIRLPAGSLGEDVIVVEGRWTLYFVPDAGPERLVDTGQRVAVSPNHLFTGPVEPGEYRLELLGPTIGRREARFTIDETTPLPLFVTPQ